ncbi:EscU/YscU/HrcU family type III secretion system export apparatus switch protein [Salinibacterium sp. dk2585]|uniref:EscU/YscU/HrcU family type III secretion system export apparatus switch protein n=1 Tax=unclassified Salinibacterium TaxID=2632331 RepID=UPI0011C250D0|nr:MULTISPECIES: EscU/YscU/HrcU family type III secretion system export apparatus switch protein [unclassified Salinibacterium]QEE60198.1 EscU/YscU/HrcU family type III secretion system export apparatus switch protein [Salinibacterium sp. dk2585]TXK55270.1 EscU/YscU/HrcU family type III secretion system export apparatus switch protein [Salinibacterium sp. dk5596]
MAEEPTGERTEQATEKRMKEVREKGQLSKSQDLTAWLGIGAAAIMIPATLALGSTAATEQMFAVARVASSADPLAAVDALWAGMGSVMTTLAPMLVAVLVAVVVGAVAQGGVHLKKFKPKMEQFDLVKGVKRTFGTQALWQGAKALMKTVVVGLVLYFVIQNLMPVLMASGGNSVHAVLEAAAGGVAAMLQFAIVAGLALAFADVFVVMKRNMKKTRMTKKEVKDEHKNSDGDPLIKGQRRARQLAMSRNRMIAAIGDADVVLVNPTHVAVALKYEPGRSAPRVVAKGAGNIAARIREEADKKGVPMVRDVPLARALHEACELGQEIPVDHYDAVARVLAFVMALKKRGAAAGVHSMTALAGAPTRNTLTAAKGLA